MNILPSQDDVERWTDESNYLADFFARICQSVSFSAVPGSGPSWGRYTTELNDGRKVEVEFRIIDEGRE